MVVTDVVENHKKYCNPEKMTRQFKSGQVLAYVTPVGAHLFFTYIQERTQRRDFEGRSPSLLEAKAMSLMDDIFWELTNYYVRSGLN